MYGFLITLAVGMASIFTTYLLFRKTSDKQHSTEELISHITGLFAASQKVGIITAYENRKEALSENSPTAGGLSSFVSRLKTEKKLVVVGSSLLGLRMYVPHLETIIKGRKSLMYETKFMLTHPCFSYLRESQENRDTGQIAKEIEEMESFLKSLELDLGKVLRFYRGTPTCFVIITSEAMLVNPYPYQIEAFNSFCLEVRKYAQNRFGIVCDQEVGLEGGVCETNTQNRGYAGNIPAKIDHSRFKKEFMDLMNVGEQREYDYRLNIGSDIYGQLYWYHYILPWFSSQAVTYKEYCDVCKGCEWLTKGYNSDECILEKEQQQARVKQQVKEEGLGVTSVPRDVKKIPIRGIPACEGGDRKQDEAKKD